MEMLVQHGEHARPHPLGISGEVGVLRGRPRICRRVVDRLQLVYHRPVELNVGGRWGRELVNRVGRGGHIVRRTRWASECELEQRMDRRITHEGRRGGLAHGFGDVV